MEEQAMPKLAQIAILAGILLLFPANSEAGEKKLIYYPPGSFLGSTPVSQLAYLSGFLDALYFVEKNGAPDGTVIACLFEDEDTTKTVATLLVTSDDAVREAKKRGDKDFSVVDAVVAMLERVCPIR